MTQNTKKITPKFSKPILRIPLYTALLLFSLQVAFWHNLPKHTQKIATEELLLQQKATLLWEIQKEKVDKINQTAKKYIEYYKLPPNHPLPPITFFKDNDQTWKLLNKKEPTQIINTFDLKSENIQSKMHTILTVGNKVPKEGEHYAHIAAFANIKFLPPNGLAIHPQSKNSFEKIKNAVTEVERKLEKKEQTQ